MKNVTVVYWSQTGNTEKMAEAIGEGATAAGASASVKTVGEANPDELKDLEGFALGCPAMGDEVLEEDEMEPFVTAVEAFAAGKKILLFGSYGWGDGQWMRDWVERMKNAGAELVSEEGLMVNEEPDDDGLEKCRDAGGKLAAL